MSDYNFAFERYRPQVSEAANRRSRLLLTRPSRLLVGGDVYTALGRPPYFLVEFDKENYAIKLSPRATVGTDTVRASVSRSRGQTVGCAVSVAQLAREMPFGYYNPISHDIFVHESKQR
jgi:hypothetical protein